MILVRENLHLTTKTLKNVPIELLTVKLLQMSGKMEVNTQDNTGKRLGRVFIHEMIFLQVKILFILKMTVFSASGN